MKMKSINHQVQIRLCRLKTQMREKSRLMYIPRKRRKNGLKNILKACNKYFTNGPILVILYNNIFFSYINNIQVQIDSLSVTRSTYPATAHFSSLVPMYVS